MVNKLTKFLNPKSIVVVGVSRDPNKLGSIVLNNIIKSNFKGEISGVNPNITELMGKRIYSSYGEIEYIPDLVIISLPSTHVNQVLREVGAKGTKNVVVLSAGYKEIGEEGVELERELLEISKEYELNLLGPNCLGFINTSVDLNASFGNLLSCKGNLRVLSQSGAIATSMMDSAEEIGLGFSEFVTLGNKSVLTEVDFLEYWLEMDNSNGKKHERQDGMSNLSPIGMYLESIGDGQRFIKILSKLTLRNPVFLLKPGKSESAKHAMQSHTGSMAGSDKVLSQALDEAGVIRCDGIEELFDLAKAFSFENVPAGNKLAIVSNAGGPAVATTDFIEDAGLELSQFSDEIKAKMYKYLPRSASVANPIDILGDALAPRYGFALELVLSQPNVDAALVILTPQVMTEIHETAEVIANVSKAFNKPVFCSFMGGKFIHSGEQILSHYKLPNYRFPERAVKVIGRMWGWNSLVNKRKAKQIQNPQVVVSEIDYEIIDIINNAKANGRIALDSLEADRVLQKIGVNLPPSIRVNNNQEAIDFANTYGYPCVLKIISSKILHKSDLGGVKVNLHSQDDITAAFDDLQSKIWSLSEDLQADCFIQVQKQVPKGIELILGVKQDVDFGGVVMFGAGGVNAELLKDSNLKIAPCNFDDAKSLIQRSKIFTLLNGFRGEAPYNLDKVADMIVKLSHLIINYPAIQDFEINPIILTYEDAYAVDGKCVLA